MLDALSKGASYAVVSKIIKKFLPKQIKVKNTKTFKQIGKIKRNFQMLILLLLQG